MNTKQLLQNFEEFGPIVISIGQQIQAWIEAGKETVSAAELAQLAAMGQYSSAQSLAALGIQIVDGKVVPIPPKA